MPSDQADRATRTGRSLAWAAGFVLLAVVAGLVTFRLFDREVITPDAPSASASPVEITRPSAATELLGDLTAALNDGTRRDALALAAPGEASARRSLSWIYDNVRDMGVTIVSMRFVDEQGGTLSASERRTLGDRAWVGNVSLGWRVEGYDRGVSSQEIALTFVDTPEGTAFGSAGGDYGTAAPLWLLEDLAVEKSRRALVATVDRGQVRRYADLADTAVRDVREVLSRWRGRLVVEVPASQEQLDRVLDAEPNAYDSIAAVTATVDGSMNPSSPVHILVNPQVFGKLGPEGSQIVLSHEATHVAVNAATSTMPMWLLEGFADYVALARTDLPVSVTASQILAQVRKDGPPRALPGPDEFDARNKLLGTSYESAWLACRLLAEEYGERRLVAFYEDVENGTPMPEAFRRLGTSEKVFTQSWGDYLRELAG